MKNSQEKEKQDTAKEIPENTAEITKTPVEIGGPKGPEPTRYGDWERRGRCIDF